MQTQFGESVCVDLGSNLIKVIVANRKGVIVQTAIAANPLGFSIPLKPNQVETLSSLLKQVFDEHKLPKKNLRLAMPEHYVATQVIEIPTLTDAELASSVHWQAQQYIPIPKEELSLNYQVLYRPEKKDLTAQNMRVLLVGINQQHLNSLVAAYNKAGLECSVLETESVAMLRNLKTISDDSSCMIINFGANQMDLTVVRSGELAMVISHQTGSEMITKALINAFNLPVDKAEEYKKNYGFDAQQVDGKIANAIVPVAQIMLSNIKNTISFYNEKNSLQAINQIYTCGGGSLVPGFNQLLNANLNLPVESLDVFSGLTGAIPTQDQAMFAVAAGLAKRK